MLNQFKRIKCVYYNYLKYVNIKSIKSLFARKINVKILST